VELRSLSGASVTSATFTVLTAATGPTTKTTSGSLPTTGADSRSLVGLGLLLVAAGATLAVVARRRAPAEGSPR
jgi:LPXTG-motif cell wall-anchored protein